MTWLVWRTHMIGVVTLSAWMARLQALPVGERRLPRVKVQRAQAGMRKCWPTLKLR